MNRAEIDKWLAVKGKWLTFSLDDCGAYKKDGEIKMFHHFVGQGHDINVYEKKYDSIVRFTDIVNAWCKNQMTKDEAADKIEALIKELDK